MMSYSDVMASLYISWEFGCSVTKTIFVSFILQGRLCGRYAMLLLTGYQAQKAVLYFVTVMGRMSVGMSTL